MIRSLVRAGLAGSALLAVTGGFSAGCLDRPVAKLTPNTSNTFVDLVRQNAVDKIDLLFMIDNSASMADKQALLQAAVPDLVNRLVNPSCVNSDDGTLQAVQPANPGDDCDDGFQREFNPIVDFHIGVISSSLGGHGADQCSPASGQTFNDTQNDRAHLIGTVRQGLVSYNNTGFLAWDPEAQQDPPGEANVETLNTNFAAHVGATGETGCGFEASLEAWYRFLVDPDPFNTLERVPCFDGDTSNGCVSGAGTDEELLAQRRAFLRPDSLLAVIMLSDENDCSVRDESQFYISVQALSGSQQFFLPRATTPCDTDPNDPCCYSCGQGTPGRCNDAGGHSKESDANCTNNGGFYANADEDNLNLRCWDQKRRFGIDFLYPTSRYVDGLSGLTVRDRFGQTVNNPIYSDLSESGAIVRDPSLVFLAGIVGVPYQNVIADAQTCANDSEACPPDDPNDLKILTASQLSSLGRWDVILGDPANNVPPTDPHMIETSAVRQDGAQHPLEAVNAAIVADQTAAPTANPINGHEYDTDNGDLQYACIFQLPTEINCDPSTGGKSTSCDCSPGEEVRNKPLCQDPATGAQGTTQFYAKAYPGLRQLQVLKDFGENAIVASVCPANPGDNTLPNFGYRPAIGAIIDRLKEALGGKCLPRELEPKEDGAVDCIIIEALPGAGQGCPSPNQPTGSERPARQDADPELVSVVKQELIKSEICTGTGCDDFTFCALNQVQGSALQECQNQESPAVAGFCYVDAEQGIGNPALVANCPASQRRLLRFAGNNIPAAGATTLIACRGASLADEGVSSNSGEGGSGTSSGGSGSSTGGTGGSN